MHACNKQHASSWGAATGGSCGIHKLGLAHARKHLSSRGPPACMHGRDAITLQRSNLMSAKMLHAWCVRNMFGPSGFTLQAIPEGCRAMSVSKMFQWGLPPIFVLLILLLQLHERFSVQPQDSDFWTLALL